MREHEWKADKGGVEACARDGCTVRRYPKGGTWQEKKRWPWYKERNTPLPPCTGKDAAPEAVSAVQGGEPHVCGAEGDECPKCHRPGECLAKPAPFPLEVVRGFVNYFATMTCMGCTWPGRPRGEFGPDGCTACYAKMALAALATLEESIRAEERTTCAQVADAEEQEAKKMERETKGNISFGWQCRAAGAHLIAARIRNRM